MRREQKRGIRPINPIKWMPLILLVLMSAACAPKKIVYTPREWESPPKGQSPSVRQREAAPQRSPSAIEPLPQGPILKRAPTIKEKDLYPGGAETVTPQEKPSPEEPPQQLAAMHLVDQAKTALGQGKVDAAISMLEQAIQVDVYNGEAFFTLAKAWMRKNSRQKALEFARKAEILFQDKPERLKAVYLLEVDLYKELGDSEKAEQFRRKASEL